MIKVILAEDHHLVRQGIRSLLERINDIEILAEFTHTGASLRPQVAVKASDGSRLTTGNQPQKNLQPVRV